MPWMYLESDSQSRVRKCTEEKKRGKWIYSSESYNIDTNVVATWTDFIPPSSIGVPQESTNVRRATKTIVNTVGNTDNDSIHPPVVTMAVLGNKEEDNLPSTGCKAQTSFSKNSGMLCEKTLYFGQSRQSKHNTEGSKLTTLNPIHNIIIILDQLGSAPVKYSNLFRIWFTAIIIFITYNTLIVIKNINNPCWWTLWPYYQPLFGYQSLNLWIAYYVDVIMCTH